MSGPATPPRTGRPPRVFLHVGSPKTGTTFLQNVLWSQRERAGRHGLLLPLDRFGDHYLASLDVRGLSSRPVHPARAVGIWDRVVHEALDWPGTVLVSHELFAATTADQAARALAPLVERAEVHVVVTARDLVRQVTAEWQEHVKHRSTTTFQRFVADLRADTARTSWFWQVQDFAGILQRWGGTLPPERLHVVTVPAPGADPRLLWRRFAGLLGLPADDFTTERSRANSSLGVLQAELLRRVNLALGERLPLPGPYPLVVKNVLAHRVLEQRPGTRLVLSPEDTDFGLAESRAVVERLRAMAVDVVGDLEELVPDPDAARAGADPRAYQAPDAEALLEESVAALADVLVVLGERRQHQQRMTDQLALARRSPVRWALLQASERHPTLMRARRRYRARRPS